MSVAGVVVRGGAGSWDGRREYEKSLLTSRKGGRSAFYIVFGLGDGTVAIGSTAILKQDNKVSQRSLGKDGL